MIYVIGKRGYIGASLLDYFGDEAIGIGRADKFPVFKPTDTIINTASYGWVPGQEDMEEAIKVNIDLPRKLEKIRNGACLIWFGSGMQRARPELPYSLTKNVTTNLLKGKAHIITLYTIYGGKHEPRHRFMGTFLKAAKHGTPYIITTPSTTRDFVHIDRLIDTITELIDEGNNDYQNIDFGCGKPRSLSSVCYYVEEALAGKPLDNVKYKFPQLDDGLEEYGALRPHLADYFDEDIRKEWERIV